MNHPYLVLYSCLANMALAAICQGVESPTFVLGQNDQRLLTAELGKIYYTSDGTDPRDQSGKPSATAKIAESPIIKETTLLGEGAKCHIWVPDSGTHDANWLQVGFDDSTWTSATPPIGYDEEDTYIPLIKHDVKERVLGKRGSVYLRWRFEIEEVPAKDEVYLDVQCDDGFVAFINGRRVAEMNAPKTLSWRSEADGKVNDKAAIEFRSIRLNGDAEGLKIGTNVLAVQALNDGLTSSDFLFSAKLRTYSMTGGTVVWDPEKPTNLTARNYHNGEWSKTIRVIPPSEAPDASKGQHWAQFLGPNGNAVYTGPPLLTEWPDDGPQVVWRHEVGAGHASPVVAEGKVIVIHKSGRDFAIECLDATTGKLLWNKKYPTKFKDKTGFDHGSRGTPTIVGDRVVFSLPDGLLGALSMKDGSEIWKHQLFEEFETEATWHGFLASPLVTNDHAIYPVGGSTAGIVAFSIEDGSIAWKATGDEVGGVSPMLVRFGDEARALVTTRTHVRCLDPTSGKESWSFQTPGQSSGNPFCASPLIYGDEVVLSGWYGFGLHRVRTTNNEPSLVWNRNDLISSHYASLILHQGHVYGYHGHASEGPKLRCVKLSTREVVWEEDHGGSGTITKIGNDLLVITDQGEIMLVAADPSKCTIKAQAQITRRYTRNFPAIANGLVYVKGPRNLVCLDLRAQQ